MQQPQMFKQIITLLKNIQFWTILSAIATITTLIIALCPEKKAEINLIALTSTEFEPAVSTDININGDSLTLIYIMPAISGAFYYMDYVTVDFPLCLQSESIFASNTVKVDFIAENKDDRKNHIVTADNGKKFTCIVGDTYSHLKKTLDSQHFEKRTNYSTLSYVFPRFGSNKNYKIPCELILYNQRKHEIRYSNEKIKYNTAKGINEFANSPKDYNLDEYSFEEDKVKCCYFNEFRIKLSVSDNLQSNDYYIRIIGLIYAIDCFNIENDEEIWGGLYNYFTKVYPNAIGIIMQPKKGHRIDVDILKKSYCKYETVRFI